jgi:hypothetical protein
MENHDEMIWKGKLRGFLVRVDFLAARFVR